MIAFILADQNLPFAVSLVLMLAIAMMEGVTTIFGAGLSGFIESALPEFDLDIDIDVDADVDVDIDSPDIGASSALSKLLGWLHIGKVPILILFVIFLTAFGLIGLGIQSFAIKTFGGMFPGTLASIPSFVLSIFTVKIFGGLLGKVIPQDETDAVSEQSFIGRVAVITLGTAKSGKPAQAKLKDQHNQTHYVMVEPDNATDVFEQGTPVLLVSRQSASFRAILNTKDILTEKLNI